MVVSNVFDVHSCLGKIQWGWNHQLAMIWYVHNLYIYRYSVYIYIFTQTHIVTPSFRAEEVVGLAKRAAVPIDSTALQNADAGRNGDVFKRLGFSSTRRWSFWCLFGLDTINLFSLDTEKWCFNKVFRKYVNVYVGLHADIRGFDGICTFSHLVVIVSLQGCYCDCERFDGTLPCF